jgi:predicted ATPase
MLLKRDSANPAPAEEAFHAAIAAARRQATRSFELRAALSLARLHQSTGRAADAHAVLAPAPEGFSPVPETPEIAEAQTLVAALEESDEVKPEAAQRQQSPSQNAETDPQKADAGLDTGKSTVP